MSNLRQAAQQALEALKCGDTLFYPQTKIAITALKAALAEEEQESVAWMEMVVANLVREGVNKHKARQLAQHFTAPPQRLPLTDEEINGIADEFIVNYRIPAGSHYDFARAIEQAHGIKGEA